MTWMETFTGHRFMIKLRNSSRMIAYMFFSIALSALKICIFLRLISIHPQGGLISLWLYEENNKLRDWKKCIFSAYSPMSSTYLCLRCSNFFNPSQRNYFGCAVSRKIGSRKSQGIISTLTYS
jgi:hypothetical protein